MLKTNRRLVTFVGLPCIMLIGLTFLLHQFSQTSQFSVGTKSIFDFSTYESFEIEGVEHMTNMDFVVNSQYSEPVLFLDIKAKDMKSMKIYRRIIYTTGTDRDRRYFSQPTFTDDLLSVKLFKRSKVRSNYSNSYSVLFNFKSADANNSEDYDLELFINVRLEYKGLLESLKDSTKDSSLSLYGQPVISISIKRYLREQTKLNFGKNWFFSGLTDRDDSPSDSEYKIKYQKTNCSMDNWINNVENTLFDESNVNRMHLISIYGDSQSEKTCHQLQTELLQADDNSDLGNTYSTVFNNNRVSIHCGVQKHPISLLFNKYRSLYLEYLSFISNLVNKQKTLFVNFSGLWDVRDGKLNILKGAKGYRKYIKLLLEATVDGLRNSQGNIVVYFLTTTVVQPLLFKQVWTSEKEKSMTQPRVEYINKALIDSYHELGLAESENIYILDIGQVSKVAVNDPWRKHDMRHLSLSADLKLAVYMLCEALP